jgi:hypothetical protein
MRSRGMERTGGRVRSFGALRTLALGAAWAMAACAGSAKGGKESSPPAAGAPTGGNWGDPDPSGARSGPGETTSSTGGAALAPAPPGAHATLDPSAPRAVPDDPSAPPAPLPATTKLARGTGGAADDALRAGDAAYDADDFALAEVKYKEAANLAPKDAAPVVGLARVAVARTNLPTDYNAAPKHPVLE